MALKTKGFASKLCYMCPSEIVVQTIHSVQEINKSNCDSPTPNNVFVRRIVFKEVNLTALTIFNFRAV